MSIITRRFWMVVYTALLATLLAGCNIDDWQGIGKEQEDFSYSHSLREGGTIDVYTRNGSVEVLGWEKDTVEITGAKYARTREGLAQVEVKVDAQADRLSIKTVFPSPVRNGAGARFVIRAPRSARVTLVNASNGAIRIEDTARVEKLETSNGSITVNQSKGPLVVRLWRTHPMAAFARQWKRRRRGPSFASTAVTAVSR
ncbi:MAG: hypothetical protein MUF01_09045 [Bryobacterales bacterium]|nr:hypothetical protein [Bryobacterales bacterium]